MQFIIPLIYSVGVDFAAVRKVPQNKASDPGDEPSSVINYLDK